MTVSQFICILNMDYLLKYILGSTFSALLFVQPETAKVFFDNLSRGYYGHNKYAFRFSLHSLGRKEYLLKIGPTLKAWFETIWHILIILIDAYCIIVIVSSVHIAIHSQFSHSCLGEEKVIYDFCCHCHYIPIWGNPKPRAILSLRNKRFDKISLMES